MPSTTQLTRERDAWKKKAGEWEQAAEMEADIVDELNKENHAMRKVVDAAKRVTERCKIEGGWQAMKDLKAALLALEPTDV